MSVQVWLCDLCYTQQIVSAEVMPMAVGGLAAFCKSQLDPMVETRIFKFPEKLIESIKNGPPNMIGFSNYCWNTELSYGFAELLKRKYPETVVVMGGPSYPIGVQSQELFMRGHPAIDFYVVKEGELAFSRLIQALIKYDFDIETVKELILGSIHAVTAEGKFIASPLTERLHDLTQIPSPYLTGEMDEFFDGTLMPILQTNRGCPFSCTYCTEGNRYFNRIYRNSRDKIAEEIEYIGQKMAASRACGGRNDLFIADSNFGMFEEDLETCRLIAQAKKSYNWPEYIKVGTGKNQKKRVLKAVSIVDGAISIAGSVQSLDPDVLVNIKRANVDVQELIELALEANKVKANSYAEVILCLPGDSVTKHIETIEILIDAGFTSIYMFQLMMLPGSEIATPQTREKFKMGTQFRVLPRCFGNYALDGQSIVAAEIEEIVTSLDSLTFDDYLYCRRFNLIVTIFYNDAVFPGLLKLLKHLGISRYAWIKAIFDSEFGGDLARIIDDFISETREELWDSRQELEAFVGKPENIQKYINDELGANLIFKYHALVTNQHLQQLAEVAHDSILKLFEKEGKLTDQVRVIVDDLLTDDVLRRIDIFKGDYRPHYARLSLDLARFLLASDDTPLQQFMLDEPRAYKFYLDQKQVDVIERSLNTYGRTNVGMTRILARVHIKTLLRHSSANPTDSLELPYESWEEINVL